MHILKFNFFISIFLFDIRCTFRLSVTLCNMQRGFLTQLQGKQPYAKLLNKVPSYIKLVLDSQQVNWLKNISEEVTSTKKESGHFT